MNVWDEMQQKAIDLRKCDILVSAAAGAGKTAVLTERILQRILSKENATSIEKMLIVTFTRAAAAEMRERIYANLTDCLQEDPTNTNLLQNLQNMSRAQISTIDSFCNRLVRDHYTRLGVEPNFRLMATEEEGILQSQVMDELLESACESKDPVFLSLLDIFGDRRNEDGIRNVLTSLHGFSVSYYDPEGWFDEVLELYRCDETDFRDTQLFRQYVLTCRGLAEECLQKVEEILVCLKDDAWLNDAYRDASEKTRAGKVIKAKEKLVKAQAAVSEFADSVRNALMHSDDTVFLETVPVHESFVRKPAVTLFDRTLEETAVLIEGIAESHATGKKIWSDFQDLAVPYSALVQEIKSMRPYVECLIGLCRDFQERLRETKKRRNAYAFNDIAHLALSLLVERTPGGLKRTEIAKEIADSYDEIYIDEYQDSNYLQEYILKSISKEEEGAPNRFMVGDLKQSIYKFRHACPEIFSKKLNTYDEKKGLFRSVCLNNNYRSLPVVINDVNAIFRRIMQAPVGGIDYDERQALKAGREDPGLPGSFRQNEVHIILQEKGDQGPEREFALIAGRIREMVESGMPVCIKKTPRPDREKFDSEAGWEAAVEEWKRTCFRPARYKDFVILMRAVRTHGAELVEALEARGIPVYMESKKGFYRTKEVEFIVNLLQILDNPYRDIPFCAVLLSDFVGLSADELLAVRMHGGKDATVYDALKDYVDANDDGLTERWNRFATVYETLRDKTTVLTVYELLSILMEELPVMEYFGSTARGEARCANLEYVLEIARNYEGTGESGIDGFVRYLDQVDNLKIDMGEVPVSGGEDDVVTVMTIHQSKGLQFPFVILALAGTALNNQDAKNAVLTDLESGLALPAVNPVTREKRKSVIGKFLTHKMGREYLGEQLRLLYVALTRAEQGFLVTGHVNSIKADKFQKTVLDSAADRSAGSLAEIREIDESPSYLRWILMREDTDALALNILTSSDIDPEAGLVDEELTPAVAAEDSEHFLRRMEESLAYEYPDQSLTVRKKKVTVSEESRRIREEAASRRIAEEEAWMKEDDKPVREADEEERENYRGYGSDYGTAMHEILRRLDMQNPERNLKECIERVKNRSGKRITRTMFTAFLKSDLYRRIREADARGEYYREERFLFRQDDGTLLQGMVDGFFIEEDELVLFDYKTDRRNDPGYFRSNYAIQLKLYGQALEKIFGMPVKEYYIYSFELNEAIPVSP